MKTILCLIISLLFFQINCTAQDKTKEEADTYIISLIGKIPVADFFEGKEHKRIINIKNFKGKSIENFCSFEGGDDFRYPQLYYVDSSLYSFFNPYKKNKMYSPFIYYFNKNDLKFYKSEEYVEGIFDIDKFYKNEAENNNIANKFKGSITTNAFGDKAFLFYIDRKAGIISLFIKNLFDSTITEIKNACDIHLEDSFGFMRNETNYGTYTLQQSIYFSPFPNFVFLTADDFKTIFVYDFKANKKIVCTDISKTVRIPLFVGITRINNIVFYDNYDYQFKIIDSNGNLIRRFNIDPEIDLEGLTYYFYNLDNKLYLAGFDTKDFIMKIYSTNEINEGSR